MAASAVSKKHIPWSVPHCFAEMLAHLLLQDSKRQQIHSPSKGLLPKRKKDPARYGFEVRDARSYLQESCKLDRTQANARLDAFLDAHLLHCPSNRAARTCSGSHTVLQPTAKGFAYLARWYQFGKSELDESGREAVENALCSPFNSMKLIELDRSLLANRVRLSTGLAIVLWNRLMGEEPQQYDSTKLTTLTNNRRRGSQSSSYSSSHSYGYGVTTLTSGSVPPIASSSPSLTTPTKAKPRSKSSDIGREQAGRMGAQQSTPEVDESPYYARTMLHPNSCNLMQYWDSEGMRIFRNLRFEEPAKTRFASPREYTVDYVISGHALLQWVMDCTTVETTAEGVKVALMLLSQRFLRHITDPAVDVVAAVSADTATSGFSTLGRTRRGMELLATSLYRLTPRGLRLCRWEHLIDEAWLDQADLEMEYLAAEARLNQCSSPPLPHENEEEDEESRDPKFAKHSASSSAPALASTPAEREAWSWENRDLPDVDQWFGELVTLRLIQAEPSLKLLFREELDKLRCSESLSFIDDAQKLLLLSSALIDAQDTVTHRAMLKAEIRCLLDRLCRHYVRVGAPLELNLSMVDRDTFLSAAASAESPDPLDIMQPLAVLKSRCVELLRDAVIAFKTGDSTRKVPLLRRYIVAKYAEEQDLENAAIVASQHAPWVPQLSY